MPEGPEVQTVVDTLAGQIKDVKIAHAAFFHPKLAANKEPEQFARCLEGQAIRRFSRIGKYLILETDAYDWIVHLRMEGKFYVLDEHPEPKDKHIHALFDLEDGRCLAYRDTRKFGRMYLYDKVSDPHTLPVFDKVGPDILHPFTDEEKKKLYRQFKSGRAVKAILLDQAVIAGIGNIYADEILFASRIHPETKGKDLTEEEVDTLLSNARKILSDAIAHKGTTIRSYTSSLGVEGEYQDQLKVHQKEGEPCPVCQTPIEKRKVGQRSTYLCPHCQKPKSSD